MSLVLSNAFGVSLFFVGVFLFVLYSRTGKMLSCIAFTAFSGLAALFLVWAVGSLTGLELTLTPFSLLTAAVVGIPGVVSMLVLLTL